MRYHIGMKKISTTDRPGATPIGLLGGISPEQFIAEYWQKKPLLVRGAMPDFSGLLTANELAGLACEDDVQARLVIQGKTAWQLEQGPFDERRFAKLPAKNWTLLVQSLNHHLQEATDLLLEFDFIPHARLDDLMVSYAPDGGGVGPHFDSYDVFLLQGQGKRHWRISEQDDLTLIEGAPLRILRHFNTELEWVLEPGDMLYLPPQVAHWGIAVGECMTYSIGFRAPSAQELASEFLSFLQEKLDISGMYQDPNLKLQQHPASIEDAMVEQVSSMLNTIQWGQDDVAEFLGKYLSEPKPHIVFEPPRTISLTTFKKRLEKDGIALGLKTQMLFRGSRYFINGELVELEQVLSKNTADLFTELADKRRLLPTTFAAGARNVTADPILIEQLHRWYLSGYLIFP